MPRLDHFIIFVDSDGDPIPKEELLFTSTREDLGSFWRVVSQPEVVIDGKADGALLGQGLNLPYEGLSADDGDPLCLTQPSTFYSKESLGQVHEIPAGTCLENKGTTRITIDLE